MIKTKLVLVEGIPGSGKTTTLKHLSKRLNELNEFHNMFCELDKDNPVSIFDTKNQEEFRQKTIEHWKKLVDINFDNLHLLESRFMQNLSCIMLIQGFKSFDIYGLYKELFEIIKPTSPVLFFYLKPNVSRELRRIFTERGQAWTDRIVNRDLNTPYHISRGHNDFEGVITFFEESQEIQEHIFEMFPYKKVKIIDPQDDWLKSTCILEETLQIKNAPNIKYKNINAQSVEVKL